MTPLEQLHQRLMYHKNRGQHVISVKFVLDCLKEERLYKLDPPTSLSDTPNIGA